MAINKISTCVAAGLLALGSASGASATTLAMGDSFTGFTFGAAGTTFGSFDFTLTSAGTFQITDAFLDGDQFEIFINGTSQGLTSTPLDDGQNIAGDYEAAFASSAFSHGSFALGPGTYSVTGVVAQNAAGTSGGGAAVRLLGSVAAVPEPATWAMMMVGFAAIGGSMRHRRKSRQAALV